MMRTEMVLETSVSFIHLTQLIAREDFIETSEILYHYPPNTTLCCCWI
jgi:hypothetical protein